MLGVVTFGKPVASKIAVVVPIIRLNRLLTTSHNPSIKCRQFVFALQLKKQP